MTKPNFFIIGAPKCGTTALSEYLRTHPQVFLSNPKEPHFFNSDFSNRYVTTLEDYMKLYSGVDEGHLAVGEASTRYLFSTVAVPEIMKFNPHAKIIVMVRNPVDMTYSLHSQAVFNGIEDVLVFSKAWRLQESRREGKHVPLICPDPKLLMYGDICLLGHQLEQLYSSVPRDQVKVIVFDDFISRTRDVYEEVLHFLVLQSDGRKDFPRVNVKKSYRLIFLQEMLFRLGTLKRVLGIRRGLGIYNIITRLNAKEARRKELPYELRRELQIFFKEDIDKLSEVLGRDLSRWVIHPHNNQDTINEKT